MGIEAILMAGDHREQEYVSEQIVEWCRMQVFMAGYEESRDAWNRGDQPKAYELMRTRMDELASIRLDHADRGWFFEEFDDRQQRRQLVAAGDDFFPSGIDLIDKDMDGGLSYTQLEVPLAYSGVGKSQYCNQRGRIAARMRRRCLHFVLEGGRGACEDRYEAAFTDTLYREIRRGDLTERAHFVLHREYMIYRENLVIRGFSDRKQWRIGYEDILTELQELRQQRGWVPDLIVIDYGDLLYAPGDNEYDRQKNGFRQLKALADRCEFRGHRGYAVCAPSQAIRPSKGADDKEHILKPRDVADCYEKVRVADAIITINRTNQEKDLAQARVHLGKYRDAEDGRTVRVRTAYDRGQFSVLGAAEPDPPPKADA
jgi:replicative DNA helicase